MTCLPGGGGVPRVCCSLSGWALPSHMSDTILSSHLVCLRFQGADQVRFLADPIDLAVGASADVQLLAEGLLRLGPSHDGAVRAAGNKLQVVQETKKKPKKRNKHTH